MNRKTNRKGISSSYGMKERHLLLRLFPSASMQNQRNDCRFYYKCAAFSLTPINSLPLYIRKKMMARNTTFSILFLQVIVLVLSPTANCLSLNDRSQLKKLTKDFVRKNNSIIFLIIYNNFK